MGKGISALSQALDFVKKAPSKVKDFATYNVVNPIKKATSGYQQQIKNANTYNTVVQARQMQAMGQIKDDPRNARDAGYTYSGVIKSPTPTPIQKQKTTQMYSRPIGPTYYGPVKAAQAQTRPIAQAVRPPVASPTPTATPQYSPGSFEAIASAVFKEYGIPLEVGFGQYAAEGRATGLGAKRNNFYNIAAFDSNPNAAFSFTTPKEGVEAYAKFISGQYDRYASPAVKQKFAQAYNLKDDPIAYIRAIEQAGYAGDPRTYQQRTTAINPQTGKKYSSYAEFVMNTPEWRKYYKQKPKKKS